MDKKDRTKARIVIVGGGFDGVYTATHLARLVRRGLAEVMIVSASNHFLFTPLLHEVATGGLSSGTVAEPLREIFRQSGVRIIQGAVDMVDTAEKTVAIGDKRIPYDYLVLSCGSKANFYNIPGAQELGLPLKSLADALRIRNSIIDVFDRASEESDAEKRKHLLSFAIVGGGPTGVELAAELAEFTRAMADKYYCDNCAGIRDDIRITLISAGSELLDQFHPSMRAKAKTVLESKGVHIYLNVAVTAVEPRGVCMADGACIPASTVLWVAGVAADMPQMVGAPAHKRIPVDEYLRAAGNDHIFVVGDASSFSHHLPGDAALPMLAQVAVQEASCAAKNITAAILGRRPARFRYYSKGALVSVGEWYAMGDIFGLHFSGRLMWWLWRTIYLFKFISWRKRFRLGLEWFIELLYPRDITRI